MKVINQQCTPDAGYSNPNGGQLKTEWWVGQPFTESRGFIAADNAG